jgi:tetratricopeptide (TPR) repeat protein
VNAGQNLDVALSLAQDARRALPDNPGTADTLAWVYYARGQYGLARELLEGAVQTDPKNADAEYHLGMTLQRLGDKPNAELHLKRAVALAHDSTTGKSAATALAQLG